MQTARKLTQLPEPFHRVKLFADLSQTPQPLQIKISQKGSPNPEVTFNFAG